MSEQDGTPHPGRILLQRAMEPLGISRNQLARDLDVPVGRISDITNGKRGITADTALRLGRYFSTGPEIWLRMQAEYDLSVARASSWGAIVDRVRVLAEAADDGRGDAYSAPPEPSRPFVPPIEAGEPAAVDSQSPTERANPAAVNPSQPTESDLPAYADPAPRPATEAPTFAAPTSPARPVETDRPAAAAPPPATDAGEPVVARPAPLAEEGEPAVLRAIPPADPPSASRPPSAEPAGPVQPLADGAPPVESDVKPEPVLELREAWVREEAPREDDIAIPPVPANRLENP